MATLEVTEKNFEETIGKGLVLLDWWAGWCGPCRRFAPIYEETSGRHPDVVFGKVDTEAQPGLAGEFGIRSIPTIMAFRDVLDELIGKLREVDMDEVRRRVSEAEEASAAQGEK